jgi:hypothetical protein
MNTRRLETLFALGLLSCALALQPQVSQHRWASFHIGSWVLLKTLAHDGSGHATYVKFTLREVTPKEAIVLMEVQGGGMTRDMSFPIPEAEQKFDRDRVESIPFKGKQLQCRAYDFDARHVTVWECPEVPGFVAMDKSPVTTTTLVDFEAK